MKLIAYVDGGYHPETGIASIGVVIQLAATGREVTTRCYRVSCTRSMGNTTMAEWEAVYAGVMTALSLGATHLTLHSDRTDITENQGRYRTEFALLESLADPLAEFRLVRGELRQAHLLACAAREPGADRWKPLLNWKRLQSGLAATVRTDSR